jgi:beta-glucosidase
MVLLRNEGGILPLDPSKSTAVIGPLARNQHDMLGPWWGQGRDQDAVSVYHGIKAQAPDTTYAEGCSIADKEPPSNTPADECGSDAGFDEAVAVARAADQVVLALGESRGQSGEAASRSEIDLPGRQEELIARIKATGKPFVIVLFNGRPLTLEGVEGPSPAILEAWFPGVQAGNAVADVLFGKVNPGGKLPVSLPRRVGQVPVYYNHEPTGRPCDVGSKCNSRYRDLPSCDPQHRFGYGLSYTGFAISNLRLSSTRVARDGRVTASVDVAKTGDRARDEVVQLYLHDPVASISQPVRRLRGFERVTLARGEADGQLHPGPWRLRLLRQPGPVRGRAGPDRRLRRQQLRRHPHTVVHGPLTAWAAAGRGMLGAWRWNSPPTSCWPPPAASAGGST